MNVIPLLPCLVLSTICVSAQPVSAPDLPRQPIIASIPPPKDFRVDDFIAKIQDRFSGITSFTYSVQHGKSDSAIYATLVWKEAGLNYYYNAFQFDRDTHTELRKIRSFDGKQTMDLREDNVVEFCKGNFPIRIPKALPSPLEIYSFLYNSDDFVRLVDFAPNSPMWSNLAPRISYAGTDKYMGKDCIVLRFFNSFNQRLGVKADYDVFFDVKTLMPMSWKAYDAEKNIIEQLDVISFETASDKNKTKNFIYPSHCTVTHYQSPGTTTGPNGVIKFFKLINEHYWTNVQINCFSPDDILIDVSSADSLIDGNTHIAIPIPK